MTNFDFHNLLFPVEFEALCRDVLEIRESPLTFTTYPLGKDGGIDIRCTASGENIIGQCKLYNPHNYNALKASLVKEVVKCKRLKPKRYILCISLELDPKKADEILNLFQGYIKSEEDIIDRQKLNKYLNDKSKYGRLLTVYSKLLIPNLDYVLSLLDNVVYRRYFNKTKRFLDGITEQHKLFHNTKILSECIIKLKKNRVIILTGNPGVGKTTTAKMIAQYMLSEGFDTFNFVEQDYFNVIDDLFRYDQKQLFVVDDFWGSNFANVKRGGDDLLRFVQILNQFKRSNSHYLILTSRSYIIKETLSVSNVVPDAIRSLHTNNFTVDLELFVAEDRAKIFLNHLLYFGLGREFISYLQYNKTLEYIITHRNYSPRHIEYFIRTKGEVDNPYIFYKNFLKYLDNPQTYWDDIFTSQTDTAKLILIILLISSDPIYVSDLKETFLNVQKVARYELNLNIYPTEFDSILVILEELFTVTEKEIYGGKVLVRFRSPGIKDFLLEYLRRNIDAWGEVLIKGALFFNQLNFVFDTSIADIDDSISDVSLYGKKIVLPPRIQETLKNKILKEFDELNFCTQGDRVFPGEVSNYHTSEETKYWKLFLLTNLFDIRTHVDVRNFVIEEVLKDVNAYEAGKIVDHLSMLEFPRIIKRIKPYIAISGAKIIADYYSSITFTRV